MEPIKFLSARLKYWTWLIVALFLLMAGKCTYASELKFNKPFTEDSGIKHHLEWIAANTRFTNALDIEPIELPIFYFLDSLTYQRIVNSPTSIAAYSRSTRSIYLNVDEVQGRHDIVIHELVHFYQHHSGETQDVKQKELEAYAIQMQFQLTNVKLVVNK